MQLIDKSFVRNPKSYVVQSLLATASVAVILTFVEVLTHAVVVAGLGASTFIVFAMPHSVTAQPRRLVGGNIIGLICGLIFHFIFTIEPVAAMSDRWEFMLWIGSALAVGLSIFMMTITNTEHPPASSIALGMVVQEFSPPVIIFVLLFAVCLAITRRLLRGYLRDLF